MALPHGCELMLKRLDASSSGSGGGGSCFEGFITPRQPAPPSCPFPYLWIRVSNVHPPRAGGLSCATLECGPGLKELLHGREGLLAQRCAGCPSLEVLVEEVRELVDSALRERQVSGPSPQSFYNAVLQELETLGWSNVAELSQDCSAVVLKVEDAGGRRHTLHLHLPPTFPAVPPSLARPADLPQPLQLVLQSRAQRLQQQVQQSQQLYGSQQHLLQQSQHRRQQRPLQQQQWQGHGGGVRGVLEDAFRQFEQAVRQYQDLWDCLEDFDSHTFVLDPPPSAAAGAQHKTRTLRGGGGACHRRISLGGSSSLAVTLDPENPRGAPSQVRFFGPPGVVEELQRTWHLASCDWDGDRTPRENLEELLERTFPSPQGARQGAAADASEGECGAECACSICYAFHLPLGDGVADMPDVHCPNPSCARPFHPRCLSDWLRGLEDTTTSFGTMFGRCPYCNGTLTMRV